MTNSYSILSKQAFVKGAYSLVPIRDEDRYLIMKWRNEQLYHLRQKEPLTEHDQDLYFKDVVHKTFMAKQPDQILFSFLKKGVCIGYGGLVHIDWESQNAEISFVMDTELEKLQFIEIWKIYLNLIELVAFQDLSLLRIYTYAYDLRPKLYTALESSKYKKEAVLNRHVLVDSELKDVLIHAKKNSNFLVREDYFLRDVFAEDNELIFKWVNDPQTRANSINSNPIIKTEHDNWFSSKFASPENKQFILTDGNIDFGQIRIDFVPKDAIWEIDYSIASEFRGKKLGKLIISLLLHKFPFKSFRATVKIKNIASLKIFRSLGFSESKSDNLINFNFRGKA